MGLRGRELGVVNGWCKRTRLTLSSSPDTRRHRSTECGCTWYLWGGVGVHYVCRQQAGWDLPLTCRGGTSSSYPAGGVGRRKRVNTTSATSALPTAAPPTCALTGQRREATSESVEVATTSLSVE